MKLKGHGYEIDHKQIVHDFDLTLACLAWRVSLHEHTQGLFVS